MSKFSQGERILIIDEEHTIRKGVINNAYDELGMAVVSFEDGAVEKVPYPWIGRIPEENEQPKEEPKPETDDGRSTKLSKDEFLRYLGNTLSDYLMSGLPSVALLGMTAYGTKLAQILFEEEQGIIITERKLRDAFAKLIQNEEPRFLTIVLQSCAVFQELVGKIFKDEVVEK